MLSESNLAPPAARPLRLTVVDALRFICAAFVVLAHIEPPAGSVPYWLSVGIFVSFNGVWAVIAFFVISGLCIHLPHARGRPLHVRSFYVARFIRIGIPMGAAVGLSLLIPQGFDALRAVLWSLYCEIGYYALYPLLLAAFSAVGILRCIAGTFLAAFLLTCVPDANSGYFWTYGVLGTTLLGLPVWLLGCLLAELLADKFKPRLAIRLPAVGAMRCLVLAVGILTRLLERLTPLKFKLTLLLASFLCAAWLLVELRQHPTNRLLQWLTPLGAAAYSLYLMHKLAPPLVALVVPALGGLAWWAVSLATAGILAWVFYVAIERPAHRLAQRLSRQLRDPVPRPNAGSAD